MQRRIGRKERTRINQERLADKLSTQHVGKTEPYDILAADGAQRIIDASLELLESSGVVFEPGSEALEILADNGCDASSEGIVRIAPDLVHEALASVSKSAKLWGRDGSNFIQIDKDHTCFFPGMTCIKVYDLETGEARQSNREDLETITRVADVLPNIDGVCIACKNIERSDIFGEIDEFAAMAENTTKPLEYLCEHSQSLEVVIEMAAAIRGGYDALRDKPYFLHIVTPLPLNFAKTHSDQIIAAVRAGVPVTSGTLPIGGASSPVTVAGCLTQSLVTDMAAMVLGQLVEKGSFCMGGSDVSFMEPATGGIGSFVQASLADMAIIQVMRQLDLPSLTGIAGDSVARRFNQDAVWGISSTMMQTFYSRPATCDYLGSLDEGITYSLHALLLCDDLAGLLRHMWKGFVVDEDNLALEIARKVGPLGNYLAEQHTAKHSRSQAWDSRYFGAKIPLSEDGQPDRDLFERIEIDLRQILKKHRPNALDDDVLQEIRAIQERFASKFGN